MWRQQSGVCLAEGFFLEIRPGCHPGPATWHLALCKLMNLSDLFPVITPDPLLGGFWADSVRSQVLILTQGRQSDTKYSRGKGEKRGWREARG